MPKSRGTTLENAMDIEHYQNEGEVPLQHAEKEALKTPDANGFSPTRTAEPLDGNRVNAIDPKDSKEGYRKGSGPQGEYDIDPDHADRSSVPRNPKDARPDQQ